MKIGVDIRVLMDKYYSGISEYTANLLTAIIRRDQSSQYRLFYNSWTDQSERLAAWEAPNVSLTACRWPNKIFNYGLQKTFAWPKLDQVLGGVDVFWSPHFNFSSFSSGASAPKKIITVHDLSFLRYPEFFSQRKNFWHRALGVKNIIRQAEAVVAVSENTKNDILELVGVTPEKVRVIYSGNNISVRTVSEEEKSQVLKKFAIGGPFVLYVGNIEPRKNISGLIAAFNRLKKNLGTSGQDLHLVLAGADGWKNRQIYKAWQNSPYRQQIIFTAYVQAAEKEVLYAAASVFAYPSYYEGFGFPPLEAMAYGVPVLSSNVSSLPEVVGQGALLINPYQELEIAQGLEALLNDQLLKEEVIAAGLKQAEIFSWDKSAAEYLDLFKELQGRA